MVAPRSLAAVDPNLAALPDNFGVSWQIVPRQLIRLLGDPDHTRAKHAFEAMMEMKRIDIAALERAADSAASSP